MLSFRSWRSGRGICFFHEDKEAMKIVVAEKISKKGVDLLREEAKWRVVETEPARDRLLPELKDADALLIRSAVQADAALLDAAPKLQVIGRAGIGGGNA